MTNVFLGNLVIKNDSCRPFSISFKEAIIIFMRFNASTYRLDLIVDILSYTPGAQESFLCIFNAGKIG